MQCWQKCGEISPRKKSKNFGEIIHEDANKYSEWKSEFTGQEMQGSIDHDGNNGNNCSLTGYSGHQCVWENHAV